MCERILKVKNLKKIFQKENGEQVQAVSDINFDVQRGEIFGFLGPNGAGKTTTIGMLTTQVKPTKGRIYLLGKDLWKNPVSARKKLSIVTQHNNLDRSLTARENLIFHARYFGYSYKEAEQRANEFLQLFELSKRADDFVGKFSGGMVQRLKIARALIHDPEIIFLDEPTTGLDPQARQLLWEQIKKVNQQGKTIFLTTHYMEEPEQLCDRVAILNQGQVKAIDTVDELKELVPGQNVVVIRLTRIDEKLLSEIEKISGVVNITVEMNTLRLYMENANPDLGAIFDWLKEKNMKVLSMNLRLNTLNDVFIHLTGRGLEK